MVLSVIDRLVAVKVRALLHDPPHKSWCINRIAEDIKCDHEAEAKDFRRKLLQRTVLEGLGVEEFEAVARDADRLASGLDRWLLSSLYHGRHCVVGVTTLANILDPRATADIETLEWEEVKRRVTRLASELAGILLSLNSCLGQLDYPIRLLAYKILYTILEPMSYRAGLPVSLADTRMPTHTIFDHLYATASMANLTLHGGEPRGYFAAFDVPGIQDFISSARKVGDYWAGSWLLSRVTWMVVEKIMRYYGPDILLSPTPRFNPVYYASLIRLLDELMERTKRNTGSSDCYQALKMLKARIETIINELLINITRRESATLNDISGQVLTPASVQLALPKIRIENLEFESKDGVISTLKTLYEESWKEVVEGLKNYFKEACKTSTSEEKKEFCLGLGLFKLIEEIVEKPKTGLRIFVVDVNEVYKNLNEFFSKNSEECDCDDLLLPEGLRPDEAAKALLFHEAMLKLFQKPSTIPIPRPFWIAQDGSLVTVSDPSLLGESKDGHVDWIPCSLCGLEPSIIRLRKKTIGPGIEEFAEEDLEKLKKFIGSRGVKLCDGDECSSITSLSEALLRIGMRPGESLGPYCLLKRLVYLAARTINKAPDRAVDVALKIGLPAKSVKSTDDVALAPFIKAHARLRNSRVAEEVAIKLCKEIYNEETNPDLKVKCLLALQYIMLGEMFDISRAGQLLGIPIDDLKLNIKKIIKNLVESRSFGGPDYVVSTLEPSLGSIEDNSLLELVRSMARKSWRNILDKIAEPTTKYLIVKADADNIGLLHVGRIWEIEHTLTCDRYSKTVLDVLIKRASVKCREEHADFHLQIENSFKAMCSLVEKLYGATLSISPSYKSALSAGLMITSIKDFYTVEDSGGVLIFSGGDDLLAIMPSTPIWKPLLFRANYEGVEGFHRAYGMPLAPAVTYGRSLSVRVAELMDIMSVEIDEAIRLLENGAKEVKWKLKEEWRKDTIVFSDSRSGIVAYLPLSVIINKKKETLVRDLARIIGTAHALRLSGLISGTLPEDLEVNYGLIEAGPILADRPSDLIRLVEHVTYRNVSLPSETDIPPAIAVDGILGKNRKVGDQELHKVLAEIILIQNSQKANPTPAVIEFIIKLFRILRVIP